MNLESFFFPSFLILRCGLLISSNTFNRKTRGWACLWYANTTPLYKYVVYEFGNFFSQHSKLGWAFFSSYDTNQVDSVSCCQCEYVCTWYGAVARRFYMSFDCVDYFVPTHRASIWGGVLLTNERAHIVEKDRRVTTLKKPQMVSATVAFFRWKDKSSGIKGKIRAHLETL